MESIDDKPVGQHRELEISEHPPEATEPAVSLPLNEGLQSKNPRLRYEAVCEIVKKVDDPALPTLVPNLEEMLGKLLGDSHSGVQEKALEFVLLGIDKHANNSEIIPVIIEKCLTSAKTTIKAKASQFLLNTAKISTDVYSTAKTFIYSKSTSAKSLVAAINLLTQLLGNKLFPVKEVIEQIVTHAGSSNSAVRNESMEFLKEANNHIGILSYIAPLKPTQQEDLKSHFAKSISGERKSTEETKKLNVENKTKVKKEGDLSKFNDKWCDNVMNLKKWSEKRDRLEELAEATDAEQIKIGNISDVTKMLKLLLNDSNISVVNLAIRIIGQLARGLRSYFSIYSKQLFLIILNKCKDKKTAMEAKKCLENLAYSLKIEDLLEDVKESLIDKSPQVKIYICSWLADIAFNYLKPDSISLWSKQLVPLLVKLGDEAVQDVRTSAFNCLGVIKGLANNPEIEERLNNVDAQKQQKIKAAEELSKGKLDSFELKTMLSNKSSERLRRSESRTEEVTPKHGLSPALSNNAIKRASSKEVFDEIDISQEEAEEVIKAKVPVEVRSDIDVGNWKEKQEKLQNLNNWLTNTDIDGPFAEILAIWLKYNLKCFKENNQTVIKELFNILLTIATSIPVTKTFAKIVVPELAGKIGEVMLIEHCQNVLMSISDSATSSYVVTILIDSIRNSKSISTIKGVLNSLLIMINEYTMKLLPVNTLVDYVKHCLDNNNPQVRTSAINVCKAMYSQLGDSVKGMLLSNVKDSLRKNLEAELAKISVQFAAVKRPLKGLAESEALEKVKPNEMIAPKNIGLLLTTKLVGDITSTAMKTRQEAKDAIDQILANANNRIQPIGLGPLISALKTRMNEPCKNLAKGFITLVGNLAIAMGQGCKQYAKIILPPLICNLADKQLTIRSETILAIDKFAEATDVEIVLNCMAPVLEKENPELRAEALTWILKNKDHLAKIDGQAFVAPLIAVMQDKSKEIRSLGEEVISLIIDQVGYHSFIEGIKLLKPAVKSSLEEMLEKYETKREQNPMHNMQELILKRCKESEKHIYKDPKRRTYKGSEKPVLRKPERYSAKGISRHFSKDSKMASGRLIQKVQKTTGQNSSRLASKETERTTYKHSERDTYKTTEPTSNRAQANPLTQKGLNELRKKGTTVLVKNRAKQGKIEARNISSSSKVITTPLSSEQLNILTKHNKAESGSLNLSETQSKLSDTIPGPAIISALKDKKERAEESKNEKWLVNQVEPKLVEKLRNTLSPAMNPTVLAYMFSNDVKQTVKALKALTEAVKSDYPLVVGIMDLLFKWCTMKLVSQENSTISKEISEFLSTLFDELYKTHNTLKEFESASILPILCEKLGASQLSLRDSCKQLIKKARDLCPVSKIYGYLMLALESTNPKTKSEALILIVELMRAYQNQMVVSQDIKTVAKLLDSNYNDVKKEAMEYLYEIYKEKKESFWRLLGQISESNKATLKQRFEQPSKLTAQVNDPPRSKRNLSSLSKNSLLRGESKEKKKLNDSDSVSISNMLANKAIPVKKEKMLEAKEQYANKDTPEKHQVIEKALELLESHNIVNKVVALTLFNEKINTLIYQNKKILIPHATKIFSTFASTLKEIFNKPMYAIPWRFCKYCLIVLSELCDSQFLVRELNEEALGFLLEQLLMLLGYDRLEMRGDNDEGKLIVLLLNKAVLRVMENSDPNKLIIALLSLFKINNKNFPMFPKLVARCLSKISKAMKSLTPLLDIPKLLLLLHDCLLNNASELVLIVIKNILNEIVKIQGESIWEDYKKSIVDSDVYIKVWIKAMLPSKEPIKALQPDDLKELLNKLKSQVTFQEGIKKLSECIRLYPSINMKVYLDKCSKPFKELVLSYLNKYFGTSSVEEDFEEKMRTMFIIQKTGVIGNDESVNDILYDFKDDIDFF